MKLLKSLLKGMVAGAAVGWITNRNQKAAYQTELSGWEFPAIGVGIGALTCLPGRYGQLVPTAIPVVGLGVICALDSEYTPTLPHVAADIQLAAVGLSIVNFRYWLDRVI